MQDSKLINDPVFGFIKIPLGLLYNIVKHPYFQRLSRIKQLGLSSVVYPGAQHTRFQHSLGAFFLMTEAIEQLKRKGHFIFDSEAEAVKAAILLHDIGHGPFSHVLEYTLVKDVPHEQISLKLMELMNLEMNGALNLAIEIFKGEQSKPFLHQLVSGQLDMDRMDYLRRDSFFTGVPEGSIGSARIIKMLDLKNEHLVVDEKGIYSIENFLIARRLMYWQVYLHKTSITYETMLVSSLLREKKLVKEGVKVFASPSLLFFLKNDIDCDRFFGDDKSIEHYLKLDDNDIWTSLKVWCNHKDKILAKLSSGMVNRRLFKTEIATHPFNKETVEEIQRTISKNLNISYQEASYFISSGEIENKMYNPYDNSIDLLLKDGSVKNIAEVSDLLNLTSLSENSKKYYLSHYRID